MGVEGRGRKIAMTEGDGAFRVGDATVTKVLECTLALPAHKLLPDWDPAVVDQDAEWLVPDHMDGSRQTLTVSVHSWLVRVGSHVILVDTGIGKGKSRPSPLFDQRDDPFLERLAAAGARPGDVTHVLLTHIHTDHVGWNTVWDGRAWVPTFPNARYLIPEAGVASFSQAGSSSKPNHGMFADSVLPVIEAGRTDLVPATGGLVLGTFAYMPSPGHSADHMSILLQSGEGEALLAGDVLHHPVQLLRPDWCSVFCADHDMARASRRSMLDLAADRGILFLSSHIAGSSAGTVERAAGTYRWRPA